MLLPVDSRLQKATLCPTTFLSIGALAKKKKKKGCAT